MLTFCIILQNWAIFAFSSIILYEVFAIAKQRIMFFPYKKSSLNFMHDLVKIDNNHKKPNPYFNSVKLLWSVVHRPDKSDSNHDVPKSKIT